MHLPTVRRPAYLQLSSPPNAVFSSPDGSGLIVLHTRDFPPSLTAYHWETFRSTDGIPLDVPDFPLQNAVLTSMISRRRIFLVGLDSDAGSIRSIAMISRRRSLNSCSRRKVAEMSQIKELA